MPPLTILQYVALTASLIFICLYILSLIKKHYQKAASIVTFAALIITVLTFVFPDFSIVQKPVEEEDKLSQGITTADFTIAPTPTLYIVTFPPTPTPPPPPPPPTAKQDEYMIVNGSTVLIRKTPTERKNDTVGEVYKGEIVKALGTESNIEGSFWYIQTKWNVTGYIPFRYADMYRYGDAITRYVNQTRPPVATSTPIPPSRTSPAGCNPSVPANYTLYIWQSRSGNTQATYTPNQQPGTGYPFYIGCITFVNYRAANWSNSLPASVRLDYIRRYESAGCQ